ncbi:hypothetical protein ACFO4N_12940 [Camelliibacillus cellulosilyticus]|uniref:ABC transmembrane type-1 domain-containing protein n=1 Tax=Camelliibacillus cellulosilyticus TaxID=2174486 RepID=A0ABV9GRR5_9BACL
MFKRLVRKPLFWLGFAYIFLWLAGSFVYAATFHNHIPTADLRYGSAGQLVDRPPYPPWEFPPLGTDDFSQNIFIVLLIGAKFTLGLALLCALLRTVLSALIGILTRLYLPKITRVLFAPFESLSYFPIALLLYLILQWVLFKDASLHQDHFTYGFWTRTWIDMLFLTLIAVPLTTRTIFNETGGFLKKPFIESATVLGASRLQLFWRHLRPFLFPRLFVIFMREVVQVLLLMAHLGVFKVAIGGIIMKENLFTASSSLRFPYALANDWAGLIGVWWRYIWTDYQYITFVPIIAVTLAILAVKGISVSVEAVLGQREEHSSARKRDGDLSQSVGMAKTDDFTPTGFSQEGI